jgi:hypothetical protein
VKSVVAAGVLVLAVFSSSVLAGPHFGHVGYGGHGYPHYYHGYGHYYHGYGHCVSFGFGFGGYYAPAPVYVAPPPVVYYPPPVYVAPPVVVQPPVAAQPPADMPPQAEGQPAPEQTQQPAPPPPQPNGRFVETGRRFHEHGDDAGRLDWVEGLLDRRPVRIYYDEFGRVKKQKWIN